MNEVKSWLESKTIWAAIITAAPVVGNLIGFDISSTINDLVTIAGAVAVIYFRIKATKGLKLGK